MASNEIYSFESTTPHIETISRKHEQSTFLDEKKINNGIRNSDYFYSGLKVKTFNRSTTPASFVLVISLMLLNQDFEKIFL